MSSPWEMLWLEWEWADHLVYLNTQASVGKNFGEGLGGVFILEEASPSGQTGFEVSKPVVFSISSFCFMTLMNQNVRSQLLL